MKIVITAPRSLGLLRALEAQFAGCRDVSIVDLDIMAVPAADAVVSPANSAGIMSGGVDQVFVYTFGQQLEDRVQARIRADHRGWLPVGQAFVLESLGSHEERPLQPSSVRFVVVAPTMGTPGPIDGTQNAFSAFRAALRAVSVFNAEHPGSIETLACPGLGTGTGRLAPEDAAAQMRAAYDRWQNSAD